MKSWLFPLMATVIGAVFVIAGFGDALRHGILLLIATAVVVLILLTMERTGDPLSRREVADMLRQVLDGTMDWYLWDYLTSISLRHDPLLEFVQFESSLLMGEQYLCGAANGHIFNEKGFRRYVVYWRSWSRQNGGAQRCRRRRAPRADGPRQAPGSRANCCTRSSRSAPGIASAQRLASSFPFRTSAV